MNYKLTIAYDGTAYHGWQIQQNGITVQEVLENALMRIFNKKTPVIGCSRTDAGVHAAFYVCNFYAETSIPVNKIPTVLNTVLPYDIRAYKCSEVNGDFNARFDTLKKTYEYKILNREVADPLMINRMWHYPISLDVKKMRKGAKILCGKHDFAAFCAAGSVVKSTVRNLMELKVDKKADVITIRATADGFLYNMVRILTGTLVYLGNGKLTVEKMQEYFEKKDRRAMGITAPPQGLTLMEVFYEQN